METLIEDVGFSLRIKNGLRREGIRTLSQLAERRECDVMKFHNFGKVAIAQVNTVLLARGLKFSADRKGSKPNAPAEIEHTLDDSDVGQMSPSHRSPRTRVIDHV